MKCLEARLGHQLAWLTEADAFATTIAAEFRSAHRSQYFSSGLCWMQSHLLTTDHLEQQDAFTVQRQLLPRSVGERRPTLDLKSRPCSFRHCYG